MEALCFWENICPRKNQKRKKVLGKKRKKKGPKDKEREPFRQEKENNPLGERLVLVELRAGVQISNKEVAVKPKSVIHKVKNQVSFYFYKYQP